MKVLKPYSSELTPIDEEENENYLQSPHLMTLNRRKAAGYDLIFKTVTEELHKIVLTQITYIYNSIIEHQHRCLYIDGLQSDIDG